MNIQFGLPPSVTRSATFFSLVFIGILANVLDVALYAYLLPSTISQDSLRQIDVAVWTFYFVMIIGVVSTGYGIHQLVRIHASSRLRTEKSLKATTNKPVNDSKAIDTTADSGFRSILDIAFNIFSLKRYYSFFWLIGLSYAIIYGIVSGVLIFHPNGFSVEYGAVETTSISTITYGPMGYVPSLVVYLTNNLGLFIVPVNFLVIVGMSALVAFNGILTIYGINQQRERRRQAHSLRDNACPTARSTTSSSISLANNVIGAGFGLFAICPTCASFYIFSILAGSAAPSIAAFSIASYSVFLGISVPLLIASAIISMYGIHKIEIIESNKSCNLQGKKNSSK
jgi:hypothetical protein